MIDEPALDPTDYPQLSAFVPAYLHQDLALCGGVEGAVRAWRHDVSAEAMQALVAEWARFLEHTRALDAGARARLLEAHFGGAWAPRSEEDLHVLTRALTPGA